MNPSLIFLPFDSKKLRDAAHDYPCVLCGKEGCTVGAHSNALEHGRGASKKTPDYMLAYVCNDCHDLIDGRRGGLPKEEKREMWLRAFARTVALWFRDGLVRVA